jgi:hypothetical protein
MDKKKDELGRRLSSQMTIFEQLAADGTRHLPFEADNELWGFFRANCETVQEAIKKYDEYMLERDFRAAKAVIVNLDEESKQEAEKES